MNTSTSKPPTADPRWVEYLLAACESQTASSAVAAQSTRPMDHGILAGSPVPSLPNGMKIGPLTIGELLASGGMARIYRGEHDGHQVAIKTPLTTSPWAQDQLKREFRIIEEIDSETTVQVRGLYQQDGIVFLEEDFVEGTTSHQWVRSSIPAGCLPPLEKVEHFTVKLAECLRDVHRANMIHRDIKPDNIVISETGQFTLVDFGLATSIKSVGAWTNPMIMPGTFRYIAPEIVLGNRLEFASDMYSLGRCLFYMLSGRLPSFDLPTQINWSEQKVAECIREQLPQETPEEYVDLCIGLHSFDPAVRPTADDVVAVFRSKSRRYSRKPKFQHRNSSMETVVSRTITDTLESHGRFAVVPAVGEKMHRELRTVTESIRGDFSKLVLRCRVSEMDHVPFRVFDPILSNLAQWLHNLPVSLRSDWTLPADSEVAQTCPMLSSLLSESNHQGAWPTPSQLGDLGDFLSRLAQERVVVLLIEHLENAEPASWELLESLIPSMQKSRLAIIGTVDQNDSESIARARNIAKASRQPQTLSQNPVGREQPDENQNEVPAIP